MKRELVFAVVGIFSLLILVVAVTLLGVGINQHQSVLTEEHKIVPTECLDPSCLESSAMLRYMHNEAVNPCDDYYQYACTGLGQITEDMLNPLDLEITQFSKIRYSNEERLRNVLDSPPSRTVPWASELKVKRFYQACLDTYDNTANSGRRFIDQIIKPSGGWQAIGAGFDENTYNLTNAMISVHSTFYRDALFRVRISPDMLKPDRRVIEVRFRAMGSH